MLDQADTPAAGPLWGLLFSTSPWAVCPAGRAKLGHLGAVGPLPRLWLNVGTGRASPVSPGESQTPGLLS